MVGGNILKAAVKSGPFMEFELLAGVGRRHIHLVGRAGTAGKFTLLFQCAIVSCHPECSLANYHHRHELNDAAAGASAIVPDTRCLLLLCPART